jgi:hypothetical protein
VLEFGSLAEEVGELFASLDDNGGLGAHHEECTGHLPEPKRFPS